jgi:cation transporter-like permease
MTDVREHLKKLTAVKRREHHPLIHKIHREYKISKKTLFYVKEYGPHTNVPAIIMKESFVILLVSALISAAGGMALENIKTLFVSIIPLIILLPTMNDMIGDYGIIVSSRFSTMLHEGKIRRNWWRGKELKILFAQVFIIALITTGISMAVSFLISAFSGYPLNLMTILKVFLITIIDVLVLLTILCFASIIFGLHYFRKKEDPNNFLIPIITSIADFGNMIIMAVLVVLLF